MRTLAALFLALLPAYGLAADLTITPADVAIKSSAPTPETVQAGEAITQGQPVYYSAADGKYYKCDSDLSEAASEAAGIALSAAGTDGYFALVRPGGVVDLGATLTKGVVYVVSDTAGGIMPSTDWDSGDYMVILGVAINTTDIQFNIVTTGVTY